MNEYAGFPTFAKTRSRSIYCLRLCQFAIVFFVGVFVGERQSSLRVGCEACVACPSPPLVPECANCATVTTLAATATIASPGSSGSVPGKYRSIREKDPSHWDAAQQRFTRKAQDCSRQTSRLSMPEIPESGACAQCQEMVCTEQCHYNAEWCTDRDFQCHELADARRVPAHTVQFFSSSLPQFPAPRCHYTQIDPYFPVTGLKALAEKEVLLLIAAHAVVVDDRVASGMYDNNATHNSKSTMNIGNSSCGKLLASDQTARAPLMYPDEIEFIAKLTINMRPTTYLEFGSGGSTNWIPPLVVRSYSLEGSEQWCDISAASRSQQCMRKAGRLSVICCPRFLKDNENVNRLGFYPYKFALDSINEKSFDLVFVDGRSRLSCAIYVLPRITNQSVVLVHDFFDRVKSNQSSHQRGALGNIFEYYDMIGHTRSVAAFKRKHALPEGYRDAWKQQANEFY